MLRRPLDQLRRRPRQVLLVAVAGLVLTIPGAGAHDAFDAAGPHVGSVAEAASALQPAPSPSAADDAPGPDLSTSELTAPSPRAPEPLTMPAAVPVHVRIEAIGVAVDLIDLGLRSDGTLEVPPDGFPAGWYTGAPTPGELGPAIIAGHVDWGGQPGVFFDLRELSTGDAIVVTRQDDSTATFRVTGVERFAKTAFPTAAVYGDLDHAGLRLITCGGSFDRQMRSYVDNLVVFAELVADGVAEPNVARTVHR